MDGKIPRERVKPEIGKNKTTDASRKLVIKTNIKEQSELEAILKEALRDMAKETVVRHRRNNRNNLDL